VSARHRIAGRGISTIIAERSAVERQALLRVLREAGDFDVLDAVAHVGQAAQSCQILLPALVVVGVAPDEPPGWIDVVRQIVDRTAAPAVVVIAAPNSRPEQVQQALDAGAKAVVQRPSNRGDRNFLTQRRMFLTTLREAIEARQAIVERAATRPAAARQPHDATSLLGESDPARGTGAVEVIAVAASTGGPAALQRVLSQLPPDHPPVLVVQHMSEAFTATLADWLSSVLDGRTVRLAEAGHRLQRSEILLAPADRHLAVARNRRALLLDRPPVAGHRPSATVLLESVAEVYGPRAIGVVLTGMGRDGADGLLRLSRMGGHTIVQDAETSVVHGMPGAAHALGGASEVLPLERIGAAITTRLSDGSPREVARASARRFSL
jgi:two-component system chemotaxis response regulator CheB